MPRLIDLREPHPKRANRFALLAFLALLAAAFATVLNFFAFAALAFALGALLLAFASLTASASAAAVATNQQAEHNRQRLAALEQVANGVWRLVELFEADEASRGTSASATLKAEEPSKREGSSPQDI